MKFEKIVMKSNQEEAIEDLTVEYPYAMHQVNLGTVTIPWHWHEELEFDYVVKGDLEVVTADQTYVFHKNDAFFINTNVLCCMHREKQAGETVIESHLFHPVFLSGHYRSVFETKYMNPILQNRNLDLLEIRGENETQRELLRRLRQIAYLQKEENMEFETRNLFSEVWKLLLSEALRRPREAHQVKLENQDRIQTMLTFIHQNYAEKITLEDIAASALVSSRECLRCFRATIDKSPIEYLMDYRLEMAKKLITGTGLGITEISLMTGFSSNAYFGKVFREKCGLTPAAYRKEQEEI